MIAKEGLPALRRWAPFPGHVFCNRGLADIDPKLEQFAVNPRRSPQGVGLSHPADERANLRGGHRAAGPVPPALPGPDEPEAGALPADDGLGLDDGDDLRPAVPEAGEQDPEHPVGGAQAWTRRGALEDSQLVPQREVLEHQGAAGSEQAEKACEDEGNHAGHHRSGRSTVQR